MEFTREEIKSQVRELDRKQAWWHDIELPYGIRTRNLSQKDLELNHNIVKWERTARYLDVKGKRVIDIGCNEGFYCLKLSAMGASYVLGVDINPLRIEKAKFVANILKPQNVEYIQKSVYDLTPSKDGMYDIAICLGFLHRVPDPFGVTKIVSDLAETAIFEWAALKGRSSTMQFWKFGHKDYDVHNSGYWRITRNCVKDMLIRNGFQQFIDIGGKSSRAILLATKNKNSFNQKRYFWSSWIS